MYSITDFLELEDPNAFISDVHIEGTQRIIVVESRPSIHFCPRCGFRMHSRGIKTRKIHHPIFQDYQDTFVLLKQRRWRCTNSDCKYESNEDFRFVNKSRRITNTTDMMIIEAFLDLTVSAASIAKRFSLSDTEVMLIFDHYVKMDRLPLSDIISIDEVHLEVNEDSKYALVIQDFHTGDPIDVLINRKSEVTEPYFASIPKEERFAVKYLITDMYHPYIGYVNKYFPNAVSVVDSFHVVQWINRSIHNYIKQLTRKYKNRDQEREKQLSLEQGRQVTLPISNEVYLLKKYKWLILSNRSNIKYHSEPIMNRHFRCLMNTYDIEYALLSIDPALKELRDLKELYVEFNFRNAGHPMDARIELDELINYYLNCKYKIFRDFAELLIKYHDPIINSFIMVEKTFNETQYYSRLSNGPIESLNRKIKDLKRLARGYRNFEHFRNRFLFAARKNPIINGSSDASPVLYYLDEDD